MKQICPFCTPEKTEGRVLYKTKNFRVIIGVNIITAGHVMIVSNDHISAFGAMSSEYDSEFINLVELVKNKVADNFSEPFMVEYGNWGQSVFHAHMHIIPKKGRRNGDSYEIVDIMKEMFIPICEEDNIEYERNISLSRLHEIYNEIHGYILAIDKDKMNIIKTGDDLDQSKVKYGLSHRAFFQHIKGLKGTRGWSNMTEKERLVDEKNAEETKKRIKF